ncbi:hypothetical protein GCM10023235_01370 [Kitasatospora terrestris]|uniref:Uncharacterized protein n=1 Tax=Kitasatospora terrestris TaxID=258051 RepID=A0ABP9D751_9ACTN
MPAALNGFMGAPAEMGWFPSMVVNTPPPAESEELAEEEQAAVPLRSRAAARGRAARLALRMGDGLRSTCA